MIKRDEFVMDLIYCIRRNAETIFNEFATKEEVYSGYVLEKLNAARNDLEILIRIAEAKKEGSKNE